MMSKRLIKWTAAVVVWVAIFPGGETSSLLAQTPENFTIAFIGDQGMGSDAVAVLNLIKNEGADAVLHQGDFDYNDDPQAWDNQINSVLGADFPYFASIGNHDKSAFRGASGYQSFMAARMNRLGISWDGDLGVKSSFSFNGIFILLTGPDVDGSNHDVYIRDKLLEDNSIWRISSWHKNMRLMQVGGKSDATGWGVYEESRRGGAIIATAHEHSYSRTHLLSSMQNQTIASTSNTLVLTKDLPETPEDEGKSFVFVSGIGGKSIRNQELSGAWWASIYTSSQNADYGALFGVFNYNGDPTMARFYFKAIDGTIPDEFFVQSALAPPQYALTVTEEGSGNVALSPPGGVYNQGTLVTLTPTPSSGYTFSNWSVDLTGSDNPATITMDSDKNVTATFILNAPPVATDDGYSVDEDNALVVAAPGALENDTDSDGDGLTAALLAATTNGALSFNGDGAFTYTPAADFNGSDGFTYTVSDGKGGSDNGSVTITVNSVNDSPIAGDDSYGTDEGTALSVAAPGVLSNDSDVDGDALTAALDTDAINGTLTLNADGSFDYVPNSGFVGEDNFAYQASDGQGGVATAQVAITVSHVPRPPMAPSNLMATATSSSQIDLTWTDNATTEDGFKIERKEGSGAFVELPVAIGPDQSAFADANLNANTTYTYRVRAFNSDGNSNYSNEAAATTLAPPNDPPYFTSDPIDKPNAIENLAYSESIASEAADPNGDQLTFSKVSGPGWLSVALNGDLSGTPGSGDVGANQFTVRVDDGNGGNAEATMNIAVDAAGSGGWTVITYDDFENGMGSYTDGGSDMSRYTGGTHAHQGNAAADIQDNSGTSSSFYHTASYNVSSFSTLEVDFWFKMVSMESNEDFWVQYFDGSNWQTVASFARAGNIQNNVFYHEVVTISRGTYSFSANAQLRFMCDASSNSDDVYLDEIEFRGLGAGGNHPPAFANDPFGKPTAIENQAYSESIAGDASDEDNDPLTFSKVNGPGWLDVAGNGTLSGTPGSSDVGANQFTVRVDDGRGGSDEATMNLTVDGASPTNDPPYFTNNPINAPNATENQAYSESIASDAVDPNGDQLAFSKVSGPGWLSVANNGNLSGTPGSGDVGANQFTVRVDDGNGGNAEATMNIAVDAAGGGGWTVITYDDFESGMGSYTDGGSDMSRYTGGTHAHQGSAAADIQDNSGTSSSFYHTASYNVSSFSTLEVDFWFKMVSMETNEDFWVQYFDGSTWQTVASFARAGSIQNDVFYHEVVAISRSAYNFPSNAQLRFTCDASGNSDDVYLDEIEFRGTGSVGGNIPPTANANGDYSGTAGVAVNFSSAGSNDSDGSITGFLWDFGDGNTSDQANPAHIYAAAGSYNVTLTVTDDQGAEDTDATTATITSGGGGTWQVITYDDFENGMGSYTDGGGDMSRYTGGTHAHQGNAAADIQDNSGVSSSFYHTASYDVSGYSTLEVEFWFKMVSMESNEDFWVQYFDGSSWQTVASFARAGNVQNDVFYHEVVTISSGTYNFPTDAKLRFVCDASRNSDDVYLDEIEFHGLGAGGTLAKGNENLLLHATDALPESFELKQNYPNPFNPITHIEFSLPIETDVSIKIYGLTGKVIKTLVNDFHPAGNYGVVWDGRTDDGEQVSSGVYIYRIVAGAFAQSRRMVMLK